MGGTGRARQATYAIFVFLCAVAIGMAVVWSATHEDTRSRPPSVDPGARTETPVGDDSNTPSPAGHDRSMADRIEDPRVTESSGLARSGVHPGVLYTHNDRGGLPHVFAIDSSGTRAVLRLATTMVDWEDAATTPDGRLWIGDIGDNDLVRSEISVLVVDEPDVLTGADLPVQTYRFAYPDGPHDAEALLVHPTDGRVLIVTKDVAGGRVFGAPVQLALGDVNRLQDLGPAPPNVTGGDYSPDGSSFVLRNQGRAFFYDQIGSEPVVVPLPDQPQGESVTYTPDAGRILVGSEGARSAILRVGVPAFGS